MVCSGVYQYLGRLGGSEMKSAHPLLNKHKLPYDWMENLHCLWTFSPTHTHTHPIIPAAIIQWPIYAIPPTVAFLVPLRNVKPAYFLAVYLSPANCIKPIGLHMDKPQSSLRKAYLF